MIPIIAIDGPSASGKGTVAQRVAEKIGFYYLDSGALYRIVAYSALQNKLNESDINDIVKLINSNQIKFEKDRIYLNNQDVSDDIRSEACGNFASKIAALKPVREALLESQRAFCRPPGLVADGRDMATVVFPQSKLKVFLTASAEVRADRRYKQLINKGISASIDDLMQDIVERDRRDQTRAESPLIQADDAFLLDTSAMSIEEAVQQILNWFAALN